MIVECRQVDIYQPVRVGSEQRATHTNTEYDIQWYVPHFFAITEKKPRPNQAAETLFVPLTNVKSWKLASNNDLRLVRLALGVDEPLEREAPAAAPTKPLAASPAPKPAPAAAPAPAAQTGKTAGRYVTQPSDNPHLPPSKVIEKELLQKPVAPAKKELLKTTEENFLDFDDEEKETDDTGTLESEFDFN